eukprot:3647413-Amphidinium_carterae.1
MAPLPGLLCTRTLYTPTRCLALWSQLDNSPRSFTLASRGLAVPPLLPCKLPGKRISSFMLQCGTASLVSPTDSSRPLSRLSPLLPLPRVTLPPSQLDEKVTSPSSQPEGPDNVQEDASDAEKGVEGEHIEDTCHP